MRAADSDRLPQINGQRGLQQINDPDKFEYSNDRFNNSHLRSEDNDEEDFRFDNPSISRTYENRNSSPAKTGGQMELKNLQQEDLANEPFMGRDATVVIEGEMRQFDNRKADKVQRYVESLVTGNFLKVQKDVNLQVQAKGAEAKAKKLQSNREFMEKQMKEEQRLWVNRTNKLFNMFLGFLAGLSLMHLITALSQSDRESFLQYYSSISNTVAIVFMILSSFCLIVSAAQTMIFRSKYLEKLRNMDIFRLEFREHYVVSLVCTIIISLCMIIHYIIPKYSNKFAYWQNQFIEDSDISIFKGLISVSNVLFILAWLIASGFNKAAIADMDLDPEELEETETQEDDETNSD